MYMIKYREVFWSQGTYLSVSLESLLSYKKRSFVAGLSTIAPHEICPVGT